MAETRPTQRRSLKHPSLKIHRAVLKKVIPEWNQRLKMHLLNQTILNQTTTNGTIVNQTTLNGRILNGTMLKGTILNQTIRKLKPGELKPGKPGIMEMKPPRHIQLDVTLLRHPTTSLQLMQKKV